MKRILVVDDEWCLAQAIHAVLSEEGYHVQVAANGKEALAAMEKTLPDVVLTDFMMPTMDGGELLRRMRAHPTLRELPVIMMSAAPDPARKEELGPIKLMRKPFDITALLAELHHVTNGRSTR